MGERNEKRTSTRFSEEKNASAPDCWMLCTTHPRTLVGEKKKKMLEMGNSNVKLGKIIAGKSYSRE